MLRTPFLARKQTTRNMLKEPCGRSRRSFETRDR
jgi:hypothetical protein